MNGRWVTEPGHLGYASNLCENCRCQRRMILASEINSIIWISWSRSDSYRRISWSVISWLLQRGLGAHSATHRKGVALGVFPLRSRLIHAATHRKGVALGLAVGQREA